MSTKSNTIKSLEKILGQELSLGLLLKAIREGEEKTQTEFAKRLGVSNQYLSDIENARRFVSPKAAIKYARKLRYSEEQFLRLCLQDLLKREGVQAIIDVKAA